MSDLGALLDKVKLAHDGFKKYSLDFASLVGAEIKLGLNETLGLSGALRGAVHDIETRLKEIDDPRLTSWMLMMRRNEKDFMLRRDQKYVAEIKKSAAEFSKALSAVGDCSAGHGRDHREAWRRTERVRGLGRDGPANCSLRRRHDEDVSRALNP